MIRPTRGAFGRTLLSTVLLLAGACATAPAPPTLPAPQDALAALNGEFRREYADARTRMLATADPVLVVWNDTAILLRAGGARSEAPVNAALYHALKTIAHVPLAIHVALADLDGPLDAPRRAALENLRRLVPPAHDVVGALPLAPGVLARQERLVTESLAYMDAVLASGASRPVRLASFLDRVRADVAANTRDAARAQLDAMHASVSRWRAAMTPEEWGRLRVVVVGAHMPRHGSLAFQYFSRLLGEPEEGARVVYAESQWDERAALDLFGTHLLDARIGEAFFGDPMRMHRDLLADDAEEYLQTLLPGPAATSTPPATESEKR